MPFEVTGRQAPEMILLDSPGQQLAQDGLLQWQSQVANWLIDHGAEDQSAAYGRILAVLVSRADGVSQDLADALRWRLGGDSEAAARTGLTEEERSILRGPQVIPAEAGLLDLLTGQSGAGEQVSALVEVLLPVFRKHRRIVVFCGSGALGASLAASLRRRIPDGRIGEHTAGRMPPLEEAVGQWRERGGILVADGSAEDGLNLQDADAVVHARLPWSPNRLEQRIGRVDRYGEGSGRPARQYVVTSPDGEDAFPGAWLSLLTGAFGIFSQSVSALQDSIDQGLTAIWAAGMTDGPAGLVGLEARVREDLARERREIDEMDMVDSIHESGSGTRDIPAAIGTLEDELARHRVRGRGVRGRRERRTALLPSPGGPPAATRGVRAGKTRSAAGAADLRQGGAALGPAVMRGGFNRTSALRIPGTRLFRTGNPFIDMLGNTIVIDDRGQASVFLRRDPRVRGEPEVYFGLDFLVEADIAAALKVTGDDRETRHAVGRQADCIFEPFMRRVWVRAGDDKAIDHLGLVAWLDRPYVPDREDTNLNPTRIGPLSTCSAGRPGSRTRRGPPRRSAAVNWPGSPTSPAAAKRRRSGRPRPPRSRARRHRPGRQLAGWSRTPRATSATSGWPTRSSADWASRTSWSWRWPASSAATWRWGSMPDDDWACAQKLLHSWPDGGGRLPGRGNVPPSAGCADRSGRGGLAGPGRPDQAGAAGTGGTGRVSRYRCASPAYPRFRPGSSGVWRSARLLRTARSSR